MGSSHASMQLFLARQAARQSKEEEKRNKESQRQEQIALKAQLISEVERRPCLWDRSCENYRKRDDTADMWVQVAFCMEKTEEWCKKTWKCLVDNYREIAADVRYTPSGSALTDVTKIKWPYFKSMSFRQDVMARRKTTCNIAAQEEVASWNIAEEDEILVVESQDQTNTAVVLDVTSQSMEERGTSNASDIEPQDGCMNTELAVHGETTRAFTPNSISLNTTDIPGPSFPFTNMPPSTQGASITQPNASTQNNTCHQKNNRNKRKNHADEAQVMLANEICNVNKQIENAEDKLRMFGGYVACTIKDLPEAKRLKCREDVLKVVHAYEAGCEIALAIIREDEFS